MAKGGRQTGAGERSASSHKATLAAHSVKANFWVSGQIGAVIYGPVVNGALGTNWQNSWLKELINGSFRS